MRSPLKMLCALSLIAIAVAFIPSSAEAVPNEPCTTISSPADAGLIPDALTINAKAKYTVQCKNPSCARWYRFDGGTQTANCAVAGQGWQLPTTNMTAAASTNTHAGTEYRFDSAGNNRLRIAALDGGAPACTVCLDAVNP